MNLASSLSAPPPAVAAALAPETVDPQALTDHELMLAVRAGEVSRLGELFERHHQPLFGYFVRLTGERTLSEDLVQLVFYRILKYRHTYRDEGRFSAWIYHLARKVAADHYRRHARHAAGPDDAEAIASLPDSAPGPGEAAARNDELALMREALARLPLDQRELLVMHRFQNLRHEEMARLLDCTVGAVKVRIHRSLTQLREAYFRLRRERAA